MTPSLQQRFVQSQGHLAADIDGETILLDATLGNYFRINSTGSRIWEMLAQPCSIREVAATLAEEFDVPETTCRQEVTTFVTKMTEAGLLRHV